MLYLTHRETYLTTQNTMGTNPTDVSNKNPRNFRFKTADIFDRTLVGRIYSDHNFEEWYNMVLTLSEEELKKQCRLFHLEMILNSPQMTQSYDTLLHKTLARLN